MDRPDEKQSPTSTSPGARASALPSVVAAGQTAANLRSGQAGTSVGVERSLPLEGTSMAPLLSDQERIFINKFVYRFEPIQRGDVVVFWYPLDHSKSFIKRVVGLPGETVEIRQGVLYVDGKVVHEPYVPPQYEDLSDFAPVRVQPDNYFVMGDHRISSNDSRVFGPVASRFIYGRAVFAYWPVDHFGSLSTTEADTK